MDNTATTCSICGANGVFPHYEVKEMMFGLREKFDYFQCKNCHCLQLSDPPADMSPYYPDNYYSFNVNKEGKYVGFGGWLRKLYYRWSLFGPRFYRRHLGLDKFKIMVDLNLNQDSRIMDVGCGNGQGFLELLSYAGMTNLVGYDPYLEKDINYPTGLQIFKQDITAGIGEWDLITYHHAFEHLPNPLENLKQVERLLSDDGCCILRVPTVSSYAWDHYRENWVQLDAPRHFHLHSSESISYLASKAGLFLDQVIYDSGHLQFMGSEGYQNDIPLMEQRKPRGRDKWMYKLRKARYKREAKALNKAGRGDQAAFFLRKK